MQMEIFMKILLQGDQKSKFLIDFNFERNKSFSQFPQLGIYFIIILK